VVGVVSRLVAVWEAGMSIDFRVIALLTVTVLECLVAGKGVECLRGMQRGSRVVRSQRKHRACIPSQGRRPNKCQSCHLPDVGCDTYEV
jgi:hypothetical protein